MCTVSWTFGSDGYDVFFNRDELHTRAPETPPAFSRRDGVTFIAPIDGDLGGTWFLTNDHGVTICLLNDYGCSWRPAPTQERFSRGHVVLAAASAAGEDEALAAIRALPLASTPAFQLLVFAHPFGSPPLLVQWQGTALVSEKADRPLSARSSSSFATEDVIARRMDTFASMVRSPSRPKVPELEKFHQQHSPTDGAYSVLMRRTDAATRSLVHVSVNRRQARFSYCPISWNHDGATVHDASTLLLEMPRRERPSS